MHKVNLVSVQNFFKLTAIPWSVISEVPPLQQCKTSEPQALTRTFHRLGKDLSHSYRTGKYSAKAKEKYTEIFHDSMTELQRIPYLRTGTSRWRAAFTLTGTALGLRVGFGASVRFTWAAAWPFDGDSWGCTSTFLSITTGSTRETQILCYVIRYYRILLSFTYPTLLSTVITVK